MEIIFFSHFPHQEIKKRLVMPPSAGLVRRTESRERKALHLFFFSVRSEAISVLIGVELNPPLKSLIDVVFAELFNLPLRRRWTRERLNVGGSLPFPNTELGKTTIKDG